MTQPEPAHKPDVPDDTTHDTTHDTTDNVPEDTSNARGRHRLLLPAAVVVLVVGLVVAAFTVPVDRVIEAPGPTWNVLGTVSQDDPQDLVTVSGTQTYPTEGALMMTTVSVTGCPGYPVTVANVVVAWLSPDQTVLDREQVCPKEVSAEEINERNETQMTGSQDAAVVAALEEAGLAESMTLTVTGVAEEQAGTDIAAGDVLVSLTPKGAQTTTLSTYAQLRELMTTIDPGTEVTLEVLRDGQQVSTTLTTLPPGAMDGSEGATEDASGSLLGLHLDVAADSDIEAEFGLPEVGGPSAGMMFALAIVDKVTPGSLTGGQDVAGTGTISVDGQVGAIGGIQQKMAGASGAGADYFLAPAGSCEEVVGHEPEGMQVFAVATLHEAVQAVEGIALGDTSGLTTCSSLQDRQD
ncbi:MULTISPECIES: YlbL family protein [Actinomyces]|uniref:YlbL family protein n=1 Tax=Actinomyces TaxID=1654 RepID=UPI001FAB03AF|nr:MULTISPECIES: S16 family serine protease [Actinomyces]